MRLEKANYIGIRTAVHRVREIAGQLRRSESSDLRPHQNAVLSLSLVTEEKEKPIFSIDQFWQGDGTTQGCAKLIASQDGPRLVAAGRILVEKVVGVEVRVSQIVVRGSMHLVGARLGYHAHHSTVAASIFRRIVVFDDAKLAHRVRIGIHHRRSVSDRCVVSSIQKVSDGVIPTAGDGELT